MIRHVLPSIVALLALSLFPHPITAAETRTPTTKQYYAHRAIEDQHGVIAPWYDGLNGQSDERVRIAVETLKRYPWTDPDQAPIRAPHFLYNGRWNISPDGVIDVSPDFPGNTPRKFPLKDWSNGDVGERGARLIFAMEEYYQYSGDAYAFGIIKLTADYLINHCVTPADHPWPSFLISSPTRGAMYGDANPRGFIQLDNSAAAGVALLRAYKMLGDRAYLDAATRWGKLFADKCNHAPGQRPWPRYANPEDVPWGHDENGNIMTGGVSMVLTFLDELSRMPEVSDKQPLLDAIATGERYLRDELLPKWSDNPTWGFNYWDTPAPFSNQNVVYWTARYILRHRERFPHWKTDVRNVITIMLNRTSPNPTGRNGVYSGAWVHTESCNCCRDTNGYGPQRTSGLLIEYADAAGDERIREMGRRMAILSAYDITPSGYIIDGLLSHKPLVAVRWFKIAVPNPIIFFIRNMAAMPEHLAPARQNHLLRASSTVQNIHYRDGAIEYTLFDAPEGGVDLLRLSFTPRTISADGRELSSLSKLDANGYTIEPLKSGDCIIRIRHDGLRHITIAGDDPAEFIELTNESLNSDITFTAHQFCILGDVGPAGGIADMELDEKRLAAPIDFWSPIARERQTVFTLSGLANKEHTVRIVPREESNPHSTGKEITLTALLHSSATGKSPIGVGAGPRSAQHVILGYPKREDFIDSHGNAWRPATEVTNELARSSDTVARHWWTQPLAAPLRGVADAEIYRYGMHGKEFTVLLTVAPEQSFDLAIHLLARAQNAAAMDIEVNGEPRSNALDVIKQSGGVRKPHLVRYENIRPRNGIIAITFRGADGKEAFAQAIAITPRD